MDRYTARGQQCRREEMGCGVDGEGLIQNKRALGLASCVKIELEVFRFSEVPRKRKRGVVFVELTFKERQQ